MKKNKRIMTVALSLVVLLSLSGYGGNSKSAAKKGAMFPKKTFTCINK